MLTVLHGAAVVFRLLTSKTRAFCPESPQYRALQLGSSPVRNRSGFTAFYLLAKAQVRPAEPQRMDSHGHSFETTRAIWSPEFGAHPTGKGSPYPYRQLLSAP